ncbi:hypothetical protein SCP_1402340 [Sparassis crispa]|uniref:Uncharacterized protein n=1 Tax=Sparassis crispa TaxID=139825 RepID=A0A401H318_9APHY|nr:hypothetical protein SCP_1402340 [Sparassis crispa]GBE88827.1 hypothetical protein SCP_1402340 [Sparassis crispa]
MDPIPRRLSRLMALERTARWVEMQAAESDHAPRPPSPSSTRQSPSTRTTTTSDRKSLPQHPSPPNPAPSMPRRHSDAPAKSAALLPFPQSPPGSGYPMSLEMGPPRADVDSDKASSADRGCHRT